MKWSEVTDEYRTRVGVYCITINNTFYIGFTLRSFFTRWHEHWYELINNVHNNKHLQRSFNKYDELDFSILEDTTDITRETYWIHKFRSEGKKLFNLSDGGDGGINPTPEARLKMSASQSESWNNPITRKRRIEGIKSTLSTFSSKIKHSTSQSESWNNLITRKRRIEGIKKSHTNPETKRKHSDAVRKSMNTPESKHKRSELIKELYAQGIFKDKKVSHNTQRKTNPNLDPEKKAHLVDAIRDPERLKSVSIKCKEHWKIHKEERLASRKRRYERKLQIVDIILEPFIEEFPFIRKLSLRKKFQIINEICRKLS